LILVNNHHLMRQGITADNWEQFGFNSMDEAMEFAAINAAKVDKKPDELVALILAGARKAAKKNAS